jgi:hypothetical protein
MNLRCVDNFILLFKQTSEFETGSQYVFGNRPRHVRFAKPVCGEEDFGKAATMWSAHSILE